MEFKYFDPLGRRCDAEAFREWYERSDLHLVRQYKSESTSVVLNYNPKPHNDFGEPKVFELVVKVKQPDNSWNIDLVSSGKTWCNINEAIDGYYSELSARGCAKTCPTLGVTTIIGNTLPPTNHELEFDLVDAPEEELDDYSTEFAMPHIEAPQTNELKVETTGVGTAFAGMADGGEAW